MGGLAWAVFTCGALRCGRKVRADLCNDGWYTNYLTPEGWHIELSDWGGGYWKDYP